MLDKDLSRTIYLFGDICEEMAEQFMYDLSDFTQADPKKEIRVVISTEGGCLYSMFAMHDIMRSISCSICTIGVGKVMSAGTILLAAGDKRLLFPNASVMIHESISETMEAGYSQFKKELKHFETLQNQMTSLYAEYTGKTVQQITSDLNEKSALYMTAQEAIDYGLADEICTLRPLAKKAKVPARKRKR